MLYNLIIYFFEVKYLNFFDLYTVFFCINLDFFDILCYDIYKRGKSVYLSPKNDS